MGVGGGGHITQRAASLMESEAGSRPPGSNTAARAELVKSSRCNSKMHFHGPRS